MSNAMTMPIALSTGSLEGYFQSVNRIPMLSAEEESMLAELYSKQGDIDAARKHYTNDLTVFHPDGTLLDRGSR